MFTLYKIFIYFSLHWVFVVVRTFSSSKELFSRCGAPAPHCRTQALGLAGSVVVAHELRCSVACGILPDQRRNLCLLCWELRDLTTGPPGKSYSYFFRTPILEPKEGGF